MARPITFASKSLSYAQSRYPVHRLEFLALKWAVCDKFSHWLRGHTTSRPLELVCIDFWSADDSSNKSLDVLMVTDHFTKLAQAYLCPNLSAKAVANQLWNNVLLCFLNVYIQTRVPASKAVL